MPSDGIIRLKWKPFNLLATRNKWLNERLNTHRRFTLDEIPSRGMFVHLYLETGHMVEAFLVGFSSQVRPILEYNIAWIEAQPAAILNAFPGQQEQWPSWWREALGTYKWLSRGDPATREFSEALDSGWHVRARDKSRRVSDLERIQREEYLTRRIALALAAGQPLLGLQFFGASGVELPPDPRRKRCFSLVAGLASIWQMVAGVTQLLWRVAKRC